MEVLLGIDENLLELKSSDCYALDFLFEDSVSLCSPG
jgi:hypothetical protein